MSFITAALIGGGAAIIGGAIASRGASKAASVQAASADRAGELQREQFERQIELQQPFRDVGLRALGKLEGASEYTPFSMSQFQQDPGYTFRMSEGMKGLERSAAARGGLLSGSTLKGIQRFGQDLASQEYTNAFNRYQTERNARLNPLQSLAGVGQTSTSQLVTGGQNYATAAGEAIGAAGQARASGYVGGANALTGALGQYLNYNQQQKQNEMFGQLMNRGGSGVTNAMLRDTSYTGGYGGGRVTNDMLRNTSYMGSGGYDGGVTNFSDFDGR